MSGVQCACGHPEADHTGPIGDCSARCKCDACPPGTGCGCWCAGFKPLGDHPHADPGDGRTECEVCGKWVHECIHSCKGVPVTEAAMQRLEARIREARR